MTQNMHALKLQFFSVADAINGVYQVTQELAKNVNTNIHFEFLAKSFNKLHHNSKQFDVTMTNFFAHDNIIYDLTLLFYTYC